MPAPRCTRHSAQCTSAPDSRTDAPTRAVEFSVHALTTEADAYGIHIVAAVDCGKAVKLRVEPGLFREWLRGQTICGSGTRSSEQGLPRRRMRVWRRGFPSAVAEEQSSGAKDEVLSFPVLLGLSLFWVLSFFGLMALLAGCTGPTPLKGGESRQAISEGIEASRPPGSKPEGQKASRHQGKRPSLQERSPWEGGPSWLEHTEDRPQVRQELKQPENPETPSRQTLVQTQTTTHPDGSVTLTRTEATTEVGGSQDASQWLQAWAAVEEAADRRWKELLFAVLLLLGAWRAYRHDWPVMATVLVGGAAANLFVGVTWGVAAIVAAGLIYLAYNQGVLSLRK